jgi:hypothetical protein
MQIDQSLVEQAEILADGSEIHDVKGLVGMYRNIEDREVAAAFERELRSFVVRKRLARLPPASRRAKTFASI